MRFAAYKQFAWPVYKLTGKRNRRVLTSFFFFFFGKLDNITQKQMDSVFYVMNVKNTNIKTYYLCLYYIAYSNKNHSLFSLNVEFFFSIISFFSGLVMGAITLGNVFGKSGNFNSTLSLMTSTVQSKI